MSTRFSPVSFGVVRGPEGNAAVVHDIGTWRMFFTDLHALAMLRGL